jgi:hypothetical protein
MRFTFRREAVAIAVLLLAPMLLGLLIAVVLPLLRR